MKYFLQMGIALGLAALVAQASATNSLPAKAGEYTVTDSVTKNGYTLVFINNDSVFTQNGAAVKQRMEQTFFEVYPKLAKTFNKKTIRRVTFFMDPTYGGVAEAANGVIKFSPKWMLRTPTDIDVVTHEVMHLVQDYGNSVGPWWLTEGIADYVRYKFGVDNEGAKWALPDYKAGQSYENGYRITARFFAWVENHHKDTMKKLDASLRDHTYTPELWKKLTGKTIDELWAAYAANPAI